MFDTVMTFLTDTTFFGTANGVLIVIGLFAVNMFSVALMGRNLGPR